MRKDIKNLIPKVYYYHITAIVVISIVGFIVFKIWLSSYTNHLQNIKVPDFSNMEVEAAQILAEENSLRIEILDTVYSETIKPGNIVYHKPAAGAFVKDGRTIFVSINSKTPLLVKMPKATNVSLRQATQILERDGLQLGTIVYKPDFADNYVFEQMYRGRNVSVGTKIPKGSRIDLVVGKGNDNSLLIIPNFIGMSYQQMKDSISSMGIIGNIMFDGNVYLTTEDSLNTKVWKQSPISENNNMMMMGETVDIWLQKN